VGELSVFLREVERIVEAWSPERDFYPWFRGHKNVNWSLLPKILRPEYRDLAEEDFRWEFRLRAWPFLPGVASEPRSDWDWYFLMQHYGLPTRLLDWTESALVALYFAVRDIETLDKANAVVWAINPWEINRRLARKGQDLLTAGEKKVRRYLPEIGSGANLPRAPIAIQPPSMSRRIEAQKGTFTLHGASRRPLENYAQLRKHCAKIEIQRSKVKLIREQLTVAGIAETSVFPELDGLCREMLEYYAYEHPE
jgi:hypothetical protein